MSVDRVKARIMTVMRNLPPLPEVTRRLMAVMRDEEASAKDVAKVLSSDQALAGKVLKLANSSFYGVANEVTTISRAVVIMGFTGIRNMALSFGTMSALKNLDSGLDLAAFWGHAMANAAAVQVLAPHVNRRIDPEEAFLAGLMHDIGAYVLAAAVPDEYRQVLAADTGSLEDRERDATGFTHAQVGQGLLQFWELPQAFADAARYHHDIEKAASGEQPLTTLVALADILACIHGGSFEPPASEEHLGRLMQSAGLSAEALMIALTGMNQKIDEMRDFVQIAGAGPTRTVESVLEGSSCVVITTDDQRREWVSALLGHFGHRIFPMQAYFNQEGGSADVRLVLVDPQTLTREQVTRLMPFLESQSAVVCILTESGTRPPEHLQQHPSLNFIFTRDQLNAVLMMQPA
ncbi:MAG TPA: HDOD domain-containing protein [Candidatus Krumholzibacteria bacterium]|nr:HDOD domain-containing protein [Candidatus Krumholzibacteria bacterium]